MASEFLIPEKLEDLEGSSIVDESLVEYVDVLNGRRLVTGIEKHSRPSL